jgi:hypothetical protein
MPILVEEGKTYTLGAADPSVPIFNACFTPPLVGQICFSLSWNPETPTQVQLCVSIGSSQDCFSVGLEDVSCIPIELDDLGLEVCFSNWSVQSSQVCFDIAFKLCAHFCVPVYSHGPICIPTSALTDYKADRLAAGDMAKLKKLLEIQRQAAQRSPHHQGCTCK